MGMVCVATSSPYAADTELREGEGSPEGLSYGADRGLHMLGLFL